MRDAVDVHGFPKPLLRGRIHLVAFVLSFPAGVLLVARAASVTGRLAAVIYAASLTALYGASTAYHRLGRTPRSQAWLRRLDHSTIYILIAGSYTPICLLVLTGAWRWSVLVGVWLAAAVGVVLKMLRFDLSARFGGTLYIVMGWAAVVAFPQLVTRLGFGLLVLLAAGGIMYTLGAVVLARRRPDPLPRIFGYHEVWHSFVVVAGICHYAVILQVVRGV